MKTSLVRLCLSVILAAASSWCAAEDGVAVVKTQFSTDHDKAKGAELGKRYRAVHDLVATKKLDEADEQARQLQSDFEALFDPKLPHYSFQTMAEYEEFIREHREEFEWIDWSYYLTLRARAFIAIDRGLYADALMQLRALEIVAPSSAATLTEVAFTMGRMRRVDEALSTYRTALLLTRKFASQRSLEPVALRGIGFMLIEQGKLEEAEQSYQESLKVDPGNKIALQELDFIRSKRASKP